jgi:predicted O-methyltransferase YrrM
VLRDRRTFYAFEEIEQLRLAQIASEEKLETTDYGTGKTLESKKISRIIKTTVKPSRQAQFLFRLIEHYGCAKILEIGTSLGITTLYLSAPAKTSHVITLEGDPVIASKAQFHFESLLRTNIHLLTGRFEETLPLALAQLQQTDFIFFDGNHRKDATVRYFKQALPFATDRSIFVFDDIYWSKEMTEAWGEIYSDARLRLPLTCIVWE